MVLTALHQLNCRVNMKIQLSGSLLYIPLFVKGIFGFFPVKSSYFLCRADLQNMRKKSFDSACLLY